MGSQSSTLTRMAPLALLEMIKYDPYNEVIKWALDINLPGMKGWLNNDPLQIALLNRIKDEDLPLFLHFPWNATPTFMRDIIRTPTIKELFLKRLKGD